MFNPPCNTHAEAVNSGIRNRLEGSPGRGKLNVKPIPLTKEKKKSRTYTTEHCSKWGPATALALVLTRHETADRRCLSLALVSCCKISKRESALNSSHYCLEIQMREWMWKFSASVMHYFSLTISCMVTLVLMAATVYRTHSPRSPSLYWISGWWLYYCLWQARQFFYLKCYVVLSLRLLAFLLKILFWVLPPDQIFQCYLLFFRCHSAYMM